MDGWVGVWHYSNLEKFRVSAIPEPLVTPEAVGAWTSWRLEQASEGSDIFPREGNGITLKINETYTKINGMKNGS